MVNKFTACIILLAGCSTTVPVIIPFPKAPTELMISCPDLDKIPPNTTKLSQVIETVSNNYAQYHECRSKVDGWMEWYDQQQIIFNGVNK